jgi:LmbE family N-acetylglucosaminyl deacetylase
MASICYSYDPARNLASAFLIQIKHRGRQLVHVCPNTNRSNGSVRFSTSTHGWRLHQEWLAFRSSQFSALRPERASYPSRGNLQLIVPITTEEEWTSLFTGLLEWRPTEAPIVVVVPHPDDEVLGVGGFLAAQRERGVDVFVLAVTDGEHAYPDRADTVQLGMQRCVEQTAALRRLGVAENKITRLRLPDSDVLSHLPELIAHLSSMVSADTHILAPWRGDFHPDHEACGLAAEQVARSSGATLSSYFFWTWHRGKPALLENLHLRRFTLDPQSFQAKQEALQCHRSQLVREGGEPILPEHLLSPAKRPFEIFLIP